mmetsp:Transcript_58153/g.138411  ORF Transcript_58153/g.138411 Transcript_58153/m.138411 type:complete len:245 (-) Transcript_58153:1340-2074(-)
MLLGEMAEVDIAAVSVCRASATRLLSLTLLFNLLTCSSSQLSRSSVLSAAAGLPPVSAHSGRVVTGSAMLCNLPHTSSNLLSRASNAAKRWGDTGGRRSSCTRTGSCRASTGCWSGSAAARRELSMMDDWRCMEVSLARLPTCSSRDPVIPSSFSVRATSAAICTEVSPASAAKYARASFVQSRRSFASNAAKDVSSCCLSPRRRSSMALVQTSISARGSVIEWTEVMEEMESFKSSTCLRTSL